jgi:hypothetical protein
MTPEEEAITGATLEPLWVDFVSAHNDLEMVCAEVACLREALLPFAKIGVTLPTCLPDDAHVNMGKHSITAKMLRLAASTYIVHYEPSSPVAASDMVPEPDQAGGEGSTQEGETA